MPATASPPVMRLQNVQGDTAELLIYGEIGPNYAVHAIDFVEELNSLPASVTSIRIRINSCGGIVSDGLAIYQALRSHPARVTVDIDGVAASIATVIAMAGDEVRVFESSLMMVHGPATAAQGNAKDFREFAETLEVHAKVMAAAYARKTGRSAEELLAILTDGQDHWFTAEEAVEAGLADVLVPASREFDAALAACLQSPLPDYMRRAPAHVVATLQNLTQGNPLMPAPNIAPAAAAGNGAAITAEQRAEIVAAERHRVDSIRCAAKSSPVLAALADRCITEGASFEAFGANALEILAQGAEPLAGRTAAVPTGRDTGADFITAASDALVVRAGVPLDKPHAGYRDFMAMDAGDLARACLTRAGRSTRDLDRVGAIRAAMSTSDFPELLGNALGKTLRQGYENEPQSHAVWARRVLVDDFKPQLRVLLSSAPELLHVPEGGEYKDGALDDESAQYAVAKYGRIIQLTWEALINDDLGAFIRVPQAMGQAARRKEADLVYALFEANSYNGPTMQDGQPLFHASHANIAAQSTGLTAESLSLARTMLRRQTAKGGGVLNVQPRFLLVPAELETAAEALIAVSARAVTTGAENAVIPNWISRLELVVEPRLAANGFYLAAHPSQIDTLEVAGLQADNGVPVVEEDSEFRRDVRSWKVRHVVAAAFTDWRGIVRVPVSA